jgi:hypothetical protein
MRPDAAAGKETGMATPIATAERLAPLAIGIGAMHRLDRVPRGDHGGRPFTAAGAPFAWSLLAYSALVSAWRARRTPAVLRRAAAALLAGSTLAAQTPVDQFAMWADNRSADPRAAGVRNLLGVESAGVGVLAAALSMTLNRLLVAGAAGPRRRGAEA